VFLAARHRNSWARSQEASLNDDTGCGELPTLPPGLADVDLRRVKWFRRLVLTLLIALVLLGAAGLLGPRGRTVSASAGRYDLEIEYPQIARGGLPVDWKLRVVRRGGFTGPVTIAISEAYLDLLDIGTVFPAPTAQTSLPPYVHLTFERPPLDILDVSFAASGQASIEDAGVHDAEAIVVTDGRPVVRVSYRTWVVP
jgi:hypothetical protein